jgi:Transposase IS66 family
VRDGDTRAIEFISLFRRLYRLEREARAMSVEARHELRRLKTVPLWESIRTKALALQPQLLPKSSLGKAGSYLLNEYEALTGYLESGRYEMDNNLVENAIRGPAVGRRRWLFIGHPDAGWRSAVIYSVITSCRRRGINPQARKIIAYAGDAKQGGLSLWAGLPNRWKLQALGCRERCCRRRSRHQLHRGSRRFACRSG